MKKPKWLILELVIICLLTACQSGLGPEQLQLQQYYGDNDAEQYKADFDILDKGPVAGGVLNLFTTEPDTLNPILTKNTYTSDFLNFIYEGLTRLDEKQKAVPQLSDSWSVSGDGLVWNFHLRDGVRWQDGQPLTTDDVEFTIQTLLNPGVDSVYKPLLLNVAACAAVDSSNVKLVLEKPNSFMPEMMTFPIIPKHQFKQIDVLSASKNFQPVGTGPYKYVSQTENKKVELRSNTNWWYLNTEGSTAKDGMYIETINMNIFSNPNEAIGAFQTGEIDAVGIETSDFAKYKGRTDLIIKKYTSRNFEFLAFNLKNPVIADNYARKAIALAIDRNSIINDILPGDAEASEMPVLPDSWISEIEGISIGTAAVNSVPVSSNQAEVTKNDTDVETNAIAVKTPKEALQLGGWKESKQGYYKMLGGVRKYLKVELIVNSNNSIRVRAAQEVCAQLEQAGITAVCIQINWNDLLTKLNTAKFDIAFTGCRIPQIPDISYLYSNSYLPAALPAQYESARNVSGYFNMQVDAYVTAMFSENDQDSRKALYKSAKQLVLNDTAYLGLYFLRNAMVYSKNIRGPLYPNTWNRYDDITHWYKPEIP